MRQNSSADGSHLYDASLSVLETMHHERYLRLKKEHDERALQEVKAMEEEDKKEGVKDKEYAPAPFPAYVNILGNWRDFDPSSCLVSTLSQQETLARGMFLVQERLIIRWSHLICAPLILLFAICSGVGGWYWYTYSGWFFGLFTCITGAIALLLGVWIGFLYRRLYRWWLIWKNPERTGVWDRLCASFYLSTLGRKIMKWKAYYAPNAQGGVVRDISDAHAHAQRLQAVLSLIPHEDLPKKHQELPRRRRWWRFGR